MPHLATLQLSGGSHPLDQYGEKGQHPSVFETPQFVVEGGIDLVGWAVRPSEFHQDAIPGNCKVYVQRSALRSSAAPNFNDHLVLTNERLAARVVNLRSLVELLGTNFSDIHTVAETEVPRLQA